jgi:hypothetical protein
LAFSERVFLTEPEAKDYEKNKQIPIDEPKQSYRSSQNYSDFLSSEHNSVSRDMHINESAINKGVGQQQCGGSQNVSGQNLEILNGV